MRPWGGAEHGAAGQSARDMAAVVRDPGGAARWLAGANGEKVTALYLRGLTYFGWVVLHDRSIPGSRSNIDHIVIGPGGLFVIDSKMWRRSTLRVNRGVLLREEVPVDFRASVWETLQVIGALGTKAEAIVCVHGCRLPFRGARVVTTAGGMHVRAIGPAGLIRHLLRQPRRFDRVKIARLTRNVQRCFPGYSGAARLP